MIRHRKGERAIKPITPARPGSGSRGVPPPVAGAVTSPHASFLDDTHADAHEHGEGALEPREEELVGTSSSHTPDADPRGEEPYGELAPSSENEGGA